MQPSKTETQKLAEWFESPRFAGIKRLYNAREVLDQRGTIPVDYPVARDAADAFHARLRELFAARRSITTFGPYSPGQAVAMKRVGIEGIYLGGWATSAKGSLDEDPGPDLASYPLSQVPDEAAPIVRALLTADRNQHYTRSRLSEQERERTPAVDYRPFIIADADTGHGGDAHVRNLIRRFVEVGVPGYHIEDQKPGAKKCGHQGGKVLVAVDEQIKRLLAARFQLDVMGVPGLIVSRTDAESATLLEGRSDERDQPFILGATNLAVPSFKTVVLATLRRFEAEGVTELTGHQLYALPESEYKAADIWLASAGIVTRVTEASAKLRAEPSTPVDSVFEAVLGQLVDLWQAEAGVGTYGEAIAEALRARVQDGERFEVTETEWREFASGASFTEVRERAATLGLHTTWDCEHVKTPDGYYQVRGGIDYAIAKSLAAAPYADLLWMETKTADLADARKFAHAIHARFPDRMLAYNLSPSFNWDTTGMNEDEMRAFPVELGKLGFVFNFITYGGHQVDGLASEEFATALRDDGMLALARLQRKLRLLESPYRTPQTLVGGPRADACLSAISGRTSTTKAMGQGSTQHQHLVQTEVSPQLLAGWLKRWQHRLDMHQPLQVSLRPHTAGSDILELAIVQASGAKVLNVVFAPIQDRRGRSILSIRDQNTFEVALRRKGLMTLAHLFLIHRYKSSSVHYLTPTDDNRRQTERMKARGIYRNVADEVGEIIVADVDGPRIKQFVDAGPN